MVNDGGKNRVRITGWTQLFDARGVALEKFISFSAYFDENNNKTEEVYYDKDGTVIINKLFDSKGLLLEEVHYDSDGSFGYKYIFTHDGAGREIERAMYSDEGLLHKRRVHEYDTPGNIVRSVWYDKEGNVEVEDNYEYTAGDRTVIKTRGAVAEWTNTHDENGKIISITGGYFSDDQTQQTRFFYSEEGRLIQKDELNSDLAIRSTTTYVYAEMEPDE